MLDNAFSVALAFVIGFLHPYLFAKIFLIQETESSFLEAQPAIIQVHSEAG